MATERTKEVVYMKDDYEPISLFKNGGVLYHRTKCFDSYHLEAFEAWHRIQIHHEGLYKKEELLKALLGQVGDNAFYPVAYEMKETVDTFFVRGKRGNLSAAIKKLFESHLTLKMFDGKYVYLSVFLMAAKFQKGQIVPKKHFTKIVMKRLQSSKNILNLENIGAESDDMIICLQNKPAFELLCNIIAENEEINKTINGLNLSNNNIFQLSPLNKLLNLGIKSIDLRYNNIQQANQLNALKCLEIEELFLTGNPCTTKRRKPHYSEETIKSLPTLEKLDGISTEVIKKQMIDKMDLMCPKKEAQDITACDAYNMQQTTSDDSIRNEKLEKNSIHPNEIIYPIAESKDSRDLVASRRRRRRFRRGRRHCSNTALSGPMLPAAIASSSRSPSTTPCDEFAENENNEMSLLKRLAEKTDELIEEASVDSIDIMYSGKEIQDSRDRIALILNQHCDMWCQVIVSIQDRI